MNVNLMGILNVTPDSFSDGGRFDSVERAVKRALEMIEEGANIIDVGGESTGPGSQDVDLEEELGRIIPVIKGIRSGNGEIMISVDTWKVEVARQAIKAGANMVNDVTALRGDPEMARVVAEAGVPIVLMYSKDNSPRTTKEVLHYDDVMVTIREFLEKRVKVAEEAGIKRENIIIDPGMGAFVSMDAKYSYEILARLNELKDLGLPILVGTSRKSFLVTQFGEAKPEDQLEGSISTAIEAYLNGAQILRVHDVKETRQAIDFVQKLH